jgi:RimJ/RimL family protein N-acetyltransferase
MPIRTPRLELVPATPELLRTELRGRDALEEALGARVPPDWPPELYDRDAAEYTLARLEAGPEQLGWWLHYFVLRPAAGEPAVLVGVGGYKGPPSADGTVEVGYGVLPAFRRRGYASEATRAMVERAFAHPAVTRVVAHTLPELVPSIGVLERCGFRPMAQSLEEGAIGFERVRGSTHGEGGG